MGAERFAGSIGNPSFSITDAQAYMSSLVDQLAANKRNTVVAGVSPAEMSKWQEKYRQAKAYKAVPADTSAPDLATEAVARGITTDALATKIITKGDQLSTIEAKIAGVGGRHQDAIKGLTTFDAIADYDFSTGWPV